MAKKCRFAVAVHVATLLALSGDQPATSEWIAGSVNTNPVVVRRILSALAKAGIVRSLRGINGGSVLAQSPDAITLLDISLAVDEAKPPPLHHQMPNQNCPVGRGIQPVLTKVLGQVNVAADHVLATLTLAQIVADVNDQA